MDEKDLVGKTIKEFIVDGYGVMITFNDETEFIYSASDAGYSTWGIYDKDGEE